MLQKMFVPVSYFLTSSPLTCTMDHTLEDVLGAMTANKYVATPHLMAMTKQSLLTERPTHAGCTACGRWTATTNRWGW